MQELQIIEQREVLGIDFKIYGDFENPLFLAKDVASWIEHSDVSKMIKSVDEDEKVKNIVRTLGGNQEMWFLTEDGLYEVLMQSRKPIARQFKKQVKQILKDLRKGNSVIISTGNAQGDLFVQMMSAVSQVLSQNMNSFKQEIKEEFEKEKNSFRNIITEQEIVHSNQLQEARNLIGFKTKNTASLTKLLKAKLKAIKGHEVMASDYHYMIAKERLFRKYVVWAWEEIPVHRYDEVHADIDSIEDLDDIYFG